MSIAESFYTYISGNSTITGVLASANAIFPESLPQNHSGFPAITYSVVGDSDISLLSGGRSDTHQASIQINIYDQSFKTVNDVATTIKSELIGYRGTLGSHTADYIRKEEAGEITLPPEPDTGLYGVRLTLNVTYC